MIYKFNLDSKYYENVSGCKNKVIKTFRTIKSLFYSLFYLFCLFIVFQKVMELNKILRVKKNNDVTINYIIFLFIIITMMIIVGISAYKYLTKEYSNSLKWKMFLEKFDYNDNITLIIKDDYIILKSYGCSLEIPKNNIQKVKEKDNLILIFNKLNNEVIMIPKGVIDINNIQKV